MHGLYLITNDDPFNLLMAKLEAALATGHVSILQYRRKKVAKEQQDHEIEQMLALCQKYNVPFLINDDLKQAQKFKLHLHLGQDDGEISDARAVLAPNAIVGRTCLNSLELAEKAIVDGASYIAFGAIYDSSTKPEAGNIGLEVIRQARAKFDVPICAIGGLTVENSKAVIDAGADSCAVVSDILGLDVAQIPKRVEAWAKLFN